jgi:hypothetical protein
MDDLKVLPPEISSAIDRVAKRRVTGSDSDDLLYARLQVLIELGASVLRDAELEVVQELRRDEDKNTYAEIARRTGKTVNAVWGRYGVTDISTPESRRRNQVTKARGERATLQVDGYTFADVFRLAGIYPDTIREAIARNPEASWFVQVEGSEKRGRTRIVDLPGLIGSLLKVNRRAKLYLEQEAGAKQSKG